MHGAGQRRIGVAVERDMAEIDPAPVRQAAAVKAQRDHRPAIRIGGQLSALRGQRLQSDRFGGGVPTARALFTDRPGKHFKAFGHRHRLFHFLPVGVNSTTDREGMVRK